MRALILTAPGSVVLGEAPKPEPAAGEALVNIELTGICGSDVSGFLGHSPRRRPPLVLGHELVGRRRDGRRVVANPLVSCGHCPACMSGSQNLCANWRLLGMDQTAGSFAEFVALPESQIYDIPDSLPSSRAVLAEPLANIIHLFRLVSLPPFFRLAIVGGGTMGSLALLTARRIGARDITVLDVNEERLSTMRDLGASTVIHSGTPQGVDQAKDHAGWGFDVVLDASGSTSARQMAFDLCKPGGQVVLLGMAQQRSEVDFVTSIRKEHRVVMSFAYTPVDFERALSLLTAGEIDLDSYTVTKPLDQGQQAFELITKSPGKTLKVLLSVLN
jgi:2-desacetyl-2-hydroxyethyl bacteriochlorophyllide A dehydrogenase